MAPAAPWRLTRQDDEALGMPAHAGGEMVDPEEVLEFLGPAGPAFHAVQQGQLTVQQRLAPPGQVAEDVADAAAKHGLVHGSLDGCSLHRVERLPYLPELVA